MEILKVIDKKFERKKFFAVLGTGAVSYFIMKSFPFKLLNRKKTVEKVKKNKIIVKANSLAVQRNKMGGNNA